MLEMEMKRLHLFFMMAFVTSVAWAGDVLINETNFPEANFRACLLNEEYGADGVLTDEEIESVTDLYFPEAGIKSLKGIEFFTALRHLGCANNQLTTLDVSQNSALSILDCGYNQLTELNITENTELGELRCNNNLLTKLDITHNEALNTLDCSHNQLTELDLSESTSLTKLYCTHNQLTTLDLSQIGRFTWAEGRNIDIYQNNIKGAGMTALVRSLPVHSGELIVRWFEDEGNVMTTRQVEAAAAKGWMVCEYLPYTLDMVYGIKISDVPDVYTYEGSLPTPVPANAWYFPDENFRKMLYVYDSNRDEQLSDEELANTKSIVVVDKGIKSLEGLEYFTLLTELICSENQLDEKAMEYVVWALPTTTNGQLKVINGNGDQNVITTTQVAAAKAKGWTALINVGGSWQEYAGSEPAIKNIAIDATNFPDEHFRACLLAEDFGQDGVLTVDEIKDTRYLSFTKKEIASLEGIGYFTELRELSCDFNSLTTLDLSKNTKLTQVNGRDNQLTSLNVNGLTKLKELDCQNSQLASLDVSGCPALTQLLCNGNQLTALNVSQNKELTVLNIYLNRIKGAAMDALIASLPTVKRGSLFAIWSKDEQNGMTTTQVDAAKAKGWVVYAHGGNGMYEYAGTDPVGVSIDEENFPDANFRAWLLKQSYGTDGLLSASETANITLVNVSNQGIKRLKGIEYFTSATIINCSQNEIQGADMDELIACLPVVSAGELRLMHYENEQNMMYEDQVAAAKAKGWTARYCIRPNYWTWYDYPGIELPDNTPVVVTKEQVGYLGFWGWVWTQDYGKDYQLTEREISKITEIFVPNRYFADLNGIEYFTALTELTCNDNYISTIDLSKNTALKRLECYDNRINGKGAEAFVANLPTVTAGVIQFTMGEYDNNSLTPAQVATVKAKGWTVQCHDGELWAWVDYAGVEPDGIEGIENGQLKVNNAGVYDLSGRQLPQLRRGVNIVRKADGTTQKVVVK